MSWEKFAQTITIERKSQYGVMSAGEWLNLGKFAKCSLAEFEVGKSYEIEGSVAPEKNGKRQKFIDSYKPHGAAAPTAGSGYGSGGQASAPAAKVTAGDPPATKPVVDYAAKADAKDAKITVLAIVKSVLESPLLPVLATDSLSLRRVVEDESRYILDMVDRLSAQRSK